MKHVIIVILSFVCGVVSAQDAVQEENQRRYRENSYLSAHLDYTYTFVNGIGGNEGAKFLNDQIEDYNNQGIPADGGFFGRHGFSLGAAYNLFLSKRYALHMQASYWQTGYRENLSFVGEGENTTFNVEQKFKANLDYAHILLGFKYYNDLGLTLNFGPFINYNMVDKIKITENSTVVSRAGTEITSQEEELFFHEHYGLNRTIFLTGVFFSVGYRYNNFEFEASVKGTGSILEEVDDYLLNVYQVGVRYKIPLKSQE